MTLNELHEQLARVCDERDRLREALEWALDNAGTEHPHYPYKDDDGKWVYPYLVPGHGLGGGVGLACFDTALDAVESAHSRKDS